MDEKIRQNIEAQYEYFHYSKNYCEENIYQLIRSLKHYFEQDSFFNQLTPFFYPTFVINPWNKVPIWKQKLAAEPNLPIIWDYHVILILILENEEERYSYILDFDTTLPFITSFNEYFNACFHAFKTESFELKRVINETNFLNYFASDRSHMIFNDEYIVKPPSYEPITNQEYTNNLNYYTQFNEEDLHNVEMNNGSSLIHFKFGLIFDEALFANLSFH
ncbi:hypothetical protein K502DRAFT_363672 [Neoconidiobolus thromboides FSU 785]|nr:hypothetical protein K502DRAFT_363672 [Neoconidiobolus thromboides FSU 785]